jgi:hypothetical protein
VDRFNRAVIDAFRRLRDEVGPTWDIYLEIGAQYEHGQGLCSRTTQSGVRYEHGLACTDSRDATGPPLSPDPEI